MDITVEYPSKGRVHNAQYAHRLSFRLRAREAVV